VALTRNYAAAGIFAVNRKGKSLRRLCKAADAAKGGIDRLIQDKGMTRAEAMAYRNREDQARRAAKVAKRKAAKKRRKAERLPVTISKPVPRKATVRIGRTVQSERPHYRKGMSSKDFYRCWEWNTLRYEVLRKHGCKCMHCGDPGNHVDHIKPRSRYPALELDPENLQVLCEACNVGKSNLYEDDWRTKGL
jgi:5-methylcytosine-specific restriction endonuclease McrA